MLELVREPGRPVTILTATSGDTGAAVARAFWGRPGVRVLVLYPRGRVSALQELQFATLGENVTALAVDGAFDDCQALVKAAFADAELTARHGLTSANSINVARLLPQTLYYAEAVAALRRQGIQEPPVIAVPSGNFGNLCAGLLARAMGLPVKAFVAATNANATVPEYLDTGNYPHAPVGRHPLERHGRGSAEQLGAHRKPFRRGSGSPAPASCAGVRRATRTPKARSASCKLKATSRTRTPPSRGESFASVSIPEKPASSLAQPTLPSSCPVYEKMGIEIAIPPALAELRGRPFLAREIPNDFPALRSALENPTPP